MPSLCPHSAFCLVVVLYLLVTDDCLSVHLLPQNGAKAGARNNET